MAMVRDLSVAQLSFQVDGGTVDQFSVVRYRGTEGLCQLYRFEIEMASTDEQIAFDDHVGKAAALSINGETGARWFHGIVGQPVVGEVMRVTGPDKKVICQRATSADGMVHVLVPKEGTCQYSFVNLDAEAWEKA